MHQIVLGVTGHFHRVGVQRIVIKEAFKDVVQAISQNVIQQDHWLTATRRFRRQVYEARDLIRRNFQQGIVDVFPADNLHRQIGVIIFQELHEVRFAVDQDRRDMLA